MKKFFLCVVLCILCTSVIANHITGGEMFYTLVRQVGNDYTYHITLKLYRDCYSTGAPLDGAAPIAIFRNNIMVWNGTIPRAQIVRLNLNSPSACIQNPPVVCYEVGYYEFELTLPGVPEGYTVTYQRCCRIAGINNLIGSSSIGATYTAQIPGTSILPDAPANNSARFTGADTVIVCASNSFCYDFGASDVDSEDSLGYAFCPAYIGGSTGNPAPSPPVSPPYFDVPYSNSFGPTSPLGSGVTLDSKTGMLCGIAPPVGIYVVTVCVTEYRKGVAIAMQRKDLQIKVGDCNVADASLKPEYITCDGFSYTFRNEAPVTPLIKTFFWDFGDGSTSTDPVPTHTYADTGIYTFKLVINRNLECSDSAYSRLKVFPGFFPAFDLSGICINKPTHFFDATLTRYGVVNSWSWDFGDISSTSDFSNSQNPAYAYTSTGTKTVRFTVSNSKGCIDTVIKDISILDKPPLDFAFKDTLICKDDTLQLQAIGNGSFSWLPATNIVNPNTATPSVYPAASTYYVAQLNDNGCVAIDSVRVRVVNFVTLAARADTVICRSDSVQLSAISDGLHFSWSPAITISQSGLAATMARPDTTTTYQIIAHIGRCTATDHVTITTIPYPGADAGFDTSVCFRTPAQLHAGIVGKTFSWSPVATLNNPTTLSPIAFPRVTTSYVLTVFDTIGCPKPGRDTVVVTVFPRLNAFAGNDTSIVVGQPLQFNASGGASYSWLPATSLNRSDVHNPVGIYDGSFDSILYRVFIVDENNCADSDFVKVKIYNSSPQVFVPTAFTPNGDGRNDIFRPIAVGLTTIEYFRVFNRWGQLVFSSTTNEYGWDGKIEGKEQSTGTFVWLVKGMDYTGKPVFAKGTVTLIR